MILIPGSSFHHQSYNMHSVSTLLMPINAVEDMAAHNRDDIQSSPKHKATQVPIPSTQVCK